MQNKPLKARLPWTLAGLALALLVVLVLPSAQIRVGAATLQGLVGTYTAPGGWQAVACNADGSTPVANAMLDNEGMLLMGGTENTAVHINYPDALKALARTDGSYQEAFFPYDDTVSPFNGATVPAWSEPGLGIGLFSSSAEARAGNFCAHGGTYSDGSGSHTITGGVTTHVSGHLHAYYKWAWMGTGAPPTDPPDHIDLLVHTSLWAGASAGYGTSGKTSGLTATASATDARFGDTVSADASGTPSASSDRKHLARLDTSGTGPASFDLDGSTDQSVDDTLPYGEFGPYPGYPGTSGYFRTTNGQTRATSNAFIKAASRIVTTDLTADSTVDAPNWDPHKPKWFSGTNCRVYGSIGLDKSLIKKAELDINGTVVKRFPDSANPDQGPNLSVVFASTHFSDDSTIDITYKVWGKNDDQSIEKKLPSTKAYNKSTVYQRGEWTVPPEEQVKIATDGARAAASHLQAMNHGVAADVRTHGWGPTAFLSDIARCTAFYANTHGRIGYLGCDVGDSISSSDVQRVRQNAQAANVPAINMALLDSCLTGGDSSFVAFLGPSTTGITDQAEAGWVIEAGSLLSNVCSNAFWKALLEKQTAKQARNALVIQYWRSQGKLVPKNDMEAYAKVYGDPNARLNGVYTGDESLATGDWFR